MHARTECLEEEHLMMPTPETLVAYPEVRVMEGCLNMCPSFLDKATFQLTHPHEGIFYYTMIFRTIWMEFSYLPLNCKSVG